jgi:hypothetical protein
MVQNVFDPLFFRLGDLPFVVAEVVFFVIRGIIGVIEIIVPFIAAVVIAVAIVQLPDIFHIFLSFLWQKKGQNLSNQAEVRFFYW